MGVMINYQFNKYRVSGEDAPVWSKDAYQLCRAEAGIHSGHLIGEILYRYHILGADIKELYKDYSFIPSRAIKALLRGRYSKDVNYYFKKMQETEPEMLDLLFKVTTTKKGEM
jgi:hypothetical protein